MHAVYGGKVNGNVILLCSEHKSWCYDTRQFQTRDFAHPVQVPYAVAQCTQDEPTILLFIEHHVHDEHFWQISGEQNSSP